MGLGAAAFVCQGLGPQAFTPWVPRGCLIPAGVCILPGGWPLENSSLPFLLCKQQQQSQTGSWGTPASPQQPPRNGLGRACLLLPLLAGGVEGGGPWETFPEPSPGAGRQHPGPWRGLGSECQWAQNAGGTGRMCLAGEPRADPCSHSEAGAAQAREEWLGWQGWGRRAMVLWQPWLCLQEASP